MNGVRPDFLVALHNAGTRRSVLRLIAARDVGSMAIFEAVAHRDITPEEGALILTLQREAEPWPVRFLRWLLGPPWTEEET